MALVKVACRHANGLTIRRVIPGPDDGGGKFPLIPDGPAVRLNGPSGIHTGTGDASGEFAEPGYTDVEREWIEAWLEQNRETLLVKENFVYIVEDQKSDAPEAEQAPEGDRAQASGSDGEGTGSEAAPGSQPAAPAASGEPAATSEASTETPASEAPAASQTAAE